MSVVNRSKCPVLSGSNQSEDPNFNVLTANPDHFFKQLRQEGPVHRVAFEDGFPVWLVTRYDDVIKVLRDPRFTKVPVDQRKTNPDAGQEEEAPIYKLREDHMLSKDAPDHTRLRTLVQNAFTPRLVQSLRPRIQQIADELLDKVQHRGKIELVEEFSYPLPISVISELLGLPVKDREKVKQWSADLVTIHVSDGNRNVTEIASTHFVAYLKEAFDYRRANPGDDLISEMLRQRDQGDSLTDEELYAMIFLLLIAGHETTAHLISNSIFTLLTNPEQLELLQQEPQLIGAAVEEMLRHSGPVLTSSMRRALVDVEVDGVTIPAGDGVLVVIASANMDENKFHEPETFDIRRTDNRHITFGYGAHFCLGAALARMEAEIAIGTLLERLPDLQFDPEVDVLEWRSNILIRGLKKLPLIF
ncbi:cytochrome P450 family protein [Chitinophaga nivalis]|uniref:Cytochrome P450 n=1 Tax=Chitinophaga nivalis TaxID=2991709 RepID=A0ABT3IP94_9BACT|nr:cytochrome P450 [Chitinophaga nivalis]MCW3464516.1 cytochrome P450 [Chitinophaga nivalis]MCW3485793.1 cytochrome P450 [Chitinophaga nivalis]